MSGFLKVVLALLVGLSVLWLVSGAVSQPEARALDVPIGDAHQLVIVRSSSQTSDAVTVEAQEYDGSKWVTSLGPFDAHIGRKGWNPEHVEGDETTPTGVYTLTEAFGLEPDPGTALPWRRVGPQDWWVSDPTSPLYNTYQPGPPDGRWNPGYGENLNDSTYRVAYRYAVVVDYNRSPVRAGQGSAIFLHVGSSPTSGCIALAEDHVKAILRWLDPAKRPRIVMGWDEEISSVGATAPVAVPAESGGLVPLAPRRVLDTRIGLGAPGPLGAGQERSLTFGTGQGVPTDAVAVVLNLTVDRPTATTYLAAYPSGTARPGTSNVNARPGEARAALAIVRLGPDRRIRLYNNAGVSQVVGDLVGYVSPSSSSGFVAREPVRLLDTRTTGVPLGPGGTVDVATGAPPGATAVLVNLTATAASRTTWIAAYASDQPYAGTSNLNSPANQDTPNLALVPLSADGRFRLLNDAGTVHMVADLAGFVVGTGGDRYTPTLVPIRMVDSRTGLGFVGPLKVGEPRTLTLSGVPSTARAVAVTLTGGNARGKTWMRVTGPGSTSFVSNLNLQPDGMDRANLAAPAISGSQVQLTTGDASAAVIVDLAGWFSPP